MKKTIIFFVSAILVAVMLFSLLPISVFADDSQDEALAENASPFYSMKCVYDSQSDKIKVEYRMKSTAVKEYEKLSVSIYRLRVGESIETFDFSAAEPKVSDITPSNITVTDFTPEGVADRISGYFLAIKTQSEENVKYITSEAFYPSVESCPVIVGFKGIQSGDTESVLYSNADTVILEIDGERLESGSSGYFFKSDGKTYTFSSAYLDEIDSRMEIYNSAGIDVLLKILPRKIEGDNYTLQSTVYAYVSFFASRYSTEENSIAGIILGDTYITDEGGSPDTYRALLYAAAVAINDQNANIGLIVPVSDDYNTATNFLRRLSDYTQLEFPGFFFTVMVTGSTNPYGIADNMSDATVKKNPQSVISTDNYANFRKFLDSRDMNGNVYRNSIYNFVPSAEFNERTLKNSYVYGYLATFFDGRVDSFIVTFNDETDKSLIDTVRYINTSFAKEKIDIENVKRIFNIDDWSDEFKQYSSEELITDDLKELDATKTLKDTFNGSSPYLQFSSTADIAYWFAGSCCNGISMGKNSSGKALVARFSQGGIENAFIIHRYKYTESFKYIDSIELELMLESQNTEYTVTVDIGGEGFLYSYTSPKLISGAKEKLYIDVSALTENNKVDYMSVKINSEGESASENKLYLYSLNAKSKAYDSETLSELIEEERERLRDSVENALDKDSRNMAAIIFIAVAVVITAVIMIMISRKQKQNQGKSEEAK